MDYRDGPPEEWEELERLSPKAAREQAVALREAISYHDREYYQEAAPEIFDASYDQLFHRLEELEEAFPELAAPNSPTRRVGASPVDELPRVEPVAPMLSLEAATDRDEVERWARRVHQGLARDHLRLVLEPKFDGLSVELVYQDGALHQETRERLSCWGLHVDGNHQVVEDVDSIEAFHQELCSRREELPYEIDGVVPKVDDLSSRQELGVRQRSPRWALAWKFAPRRRETTVRDIVVQVGRTGKLTPVALLDPVDVKGVTVSRASLHNADEVGRKDIRVGDRVAIARAGDVIPEVLERVGHAGSTRSEPFEMPAECPSCGSEVVREGAYHVCAAGLSCRSQLMARLLHYGSRGALDIAELGEETCRELVEAGWMESLGEEECRQLVDRPSRAQPGAPREQ